METEYCSKGHELTDETRGVRKDGYVFCRLCQREYNRERKAKVLRERIPSPFSLAELFAMFMDKTESTDEVPDVPDPPPGDCLIWTGAHNGGYGEFGRGRPPGPRTRKAHRWLYEFLHGPLDDGMEMDHLCDVRDCVAPWHVEPVDRKEHAERTVERRRWREQRDAELSLSQR